MVILALLAVFILIPMMLLAFRFFYDTWDDIGGPMIKNIGFLLTIPYKFAKWVYSGGRM